LHALKNHTQGETVLVEETREMYTWDNGWVKVETKGEGFGLSLYELNRSIVD
jgi:hypothetical protein